jgi:hypothetical protein
VRAFLSHSSADVLLAKRIFEFLRDQAVSVWFDRVELRPGDGLLSAISSGIEQAGFLLALITRNSVASPWVQKELSVALAREIGGSPMKVVALRVDDSPLPPMLADKIYVPVTSDQREFHDIVPALFRNSFILDLQMTDDLRLTRFSISRDLYDYMRSKDSTVRVRIFNNSFTSQARHIVHEWARELSENEDESYKGLLRQIQEQFVFYEIQLPLFWTTLADCISGLCDAGFADLGKNMDAVEILAHSIENTVTIALYTLSRHIRKSISSTSAKKFGSKGFTEWLAKAEQFEYRFGDEYFTLHEIIAKIVEPSFVDKLEELHLTGNKEKHVMDARVIVPLLGDSRTVMMMGGERPDREFPPVPWYLLCLPQVIHRTIVTAVFGAGKPIHELSEKIGFAREDFTLVSLP